MVDNETYEESQQYGKEAGSPPEKKETNELKPWKRGRSFARRGVTVEIKVCI